MTPTLAVNELEDDYKSDECDENVASELFFNAFFNQSSIVVSCEDFINFKSSNCPEYPEIEKSTKNALTKSEKIGDAPLAKVPATCSGKAELANGATADEPDETDCGRRKSSSKLNQNESDNEGIAAKVKTQKLVKPERSSKLKRKSLAKREKSTAGPSKIVKCEDSEDSDDINANIKTKRKKAKALPSVLKRTKDGILTTAGKFLKVVHSGDDDDDDIEYIELDSTDLPTLELELSTEDEISLGDDDDIELNVVSFARGIPDKVSFTTGLSAEEHKRLWHVDIDDKYRHLRRNRYHTVKECRNCRRSGHLTHECIEPERIVCVLCGELNHLAARCPNKMCSTCKREGHFSWRCFRMQSLLEMKCRICSVYGHTADICPDTWRRYHCTTTEGPPIAPEIRETLPNERKFCSWCGRRGHLAFECRKAGNAGIASRFVHSYREPQSSGSKFTDEKLGKKMTKKMRKEMAARSRQQTLQAELGRASVFGGDFIPLGAASKKRKRGQGSTNSDSIQTQKKDKRMRKSQEFSRSFETSQKNFRKKQKLEPEFIGIEMLPSVKKRRQKQASMESMDGERPKNRRKERRKLKRMQCRNEREKDKKKHAKRKGKF